jgi:ammonium transporter, Amt family
MMWACMAAGSIINVQWYFWGYSLTFSPTATNGFIGDLNHLGLRSTLGQPSPGSPLVSALLYAFYQVSFLRTENNDSLTGPDAILRCHSCYHCGRCS